MRVSFWLLIETLKGPFMPSTVLLGAQWGDEGKGKITDLIASDYDYVVRYQGGNNAGHTVIHGDTKLALHLIPSGVMYDHITPVIGNGCVVDPKVLVKEMNMLEGEGFSCERLRISCDAHIIMPYHIDLDGASERHLGKHKIGTTKRGIGPAYEDKISRCGIRVQDLLDEKIFREKVEAALFLKNQILTKIYGLEPYTVDQICDMYLPYADVMRAHMAETTQLLNAELRAGKNVLFEGAQGTMLDVDHGTYPFVTSSSCCAGGAPTGSGVGPKAISKVLGIAKAYITRVGSGPFPTELKDETGDLLRKVGGEYGVTTGRERRCGWFDAVQARYAVEVNSMTDMALTKLDVLSCVPRIKVCVAYEADGQRYDYFPMQHSVIYPKNVTPIYEELPGWEGVDISDCKKFEDLPANAQSYVKYLEEISGVKASIIAVGPDRNQTIFNGWESR